MSQEEKSPLNNSYWQEYLGSSPSRIELPFDNTKEAGHITELAKESIIFPLSIAEALKELSDELNADMCSVMLAGFYTLLYRYCEPEEIIIALTFAGKHNIALVSQGAPGLILPLRLELGKKTSFKTVIDKVSSALTAIQDYLEQRDSQAANEIFLSVQEINTITPVAFTFSEDSDLASISSDNDSSPVLEMVIQEQEGSFSVSLQYDKNLFAAATIKRMLGHFCNLLSAARRDSSQKISQIEMLSEEERHQVLVEWNLTNQPFPHQDYLHRMFENQADRNPDAVAVVHQGNIISYGVLNKKSNQLAHYLRAQGLQSGEMVGIYMGRCIDAIIAILGILKAGGAYLPLDAGYPKERLDFIIDNSRASFLITLERHKVVIGESQKTILCLDSLNEKLSVYPGDNPAGVSHEQDIALVLYTSGSTGNPKGVQITHGNMINNCFIWEHTFRLSTNITAICQMAFFSFAVFQGDLFRALSFGKKVVICTTNDLMSPHKLYQLIQEEHIDFAEFVPTIIRELAHYVRSNELDLHFMKIIIVSADRWYLREHQEIQKLCGPDTRLVHVYGLSETSLDSTYFLGTDHILNPNQPTPIGRPFPNVRVYILDEFQQPVPVGITGELYIGGAGITKGYLNRPDLTAENFLPDPYSGNENNRLFRTGDLARYLPDGNIAFLGRGDQQIKIRGFRVEPGEIEAQLAKHYLISTAIVQPWEPTAGVIQLVAYYVAEEDPPPPPDILRAYLKKVLPEFMIPSRFIPLRTLPLTPSGKVNRSALPQPTAGRPELDQPFVTPKEKTEKLLADLWRDLLQIEQIGAQDNLFDLGGTSLVCIQMVAILAQQHDIDIPVVTVFEHPTVRGLAQIIDAPAKAPSSPKKKAVKKADDQNNRIAIIAAAGRFPGANTIEQFWHNLSNGIESISFFKDNELDADIDQTQVHDQHYVKARGIVTGAEFFDAPFFSISPLEAQMMDPQHRIFLEITYEALERAGYNPKNYDGKIGVFSGSNNNSYFLTRVQHRPDLLERLGDFQIMVASEKDYIASQVAYKLDLKGPALSIYTACSTSLVAVVSAVENLLNDNCDMALAGGAAITVPQRVGYLYEEGAIFSKDGHTRPFDAEATGTVFSDGAGVVLLKRLADAQRDDDEIIAVICGAAYNNDGADKMSFSAPGIKGQVDVISCALDKAGVTPESISYVETHGTGTPLGDPIEIAALSQALPNNARNKNSCAIGSVKSNVGHLTAAAGVAGLIKTALALKYGEIPPSLHFQKPNPQIDFDNSPFFVNTRLRKWEPGPAPRRAGVSSFGIGGTNAHVILEEAPLRKPDQCDNTRPYELMVLSAKNTQALEESTKELNDFLSGSTPVSFRDAAFTLRSGRAHFNQRRFIVCRDTAELAQLIDSPNPAYTGSGTIPAADMPLTFLFPGQGSQYVGMGYSIYKHEPVFAQNIDHCAEILQQHIGEDIRNILYPQDNPGEKAAERLMQTRFAQPAIFILEYALAQLWLHWGIEPQAMIGHSIGEFVCACLAGVISLKDALKLVAIRADLMQKMSRGSMLSVQLTAAELESHINESVEISCINEPSLCVLSGPSDAIGELEIQFEKNDIGCRRLHTSHAFHCWMMNPAVAEVLETVKNIPLSTPQIPFVSCVTGRWITDEEALDPDYWANHLRKPVLFAPGIRTLCENDQRILLEIGPRPTLTTLARRQLHGSEQVFVPTLAGKPGDTEWRELLSALGKLWINGVAPGWGAFSKGKKGRRIVLPTYPFQKKRYWIDAVSTKPQGIIQPFSEQNPEAIENLNDIKEVQNMASNLSARATQLVPEIQQVLEEVSGLDIAGTEASLQFIDLGLESLALTQAALVLKKRFSVDVSFRQLMEELNTCSKLSEFLDSKMPQEAQSPSHSTTPAEPQMPTQPPVPGAKLGRDPQGNAAWYIPDPQRPGKYLKLK